MIDFTLIGTIFLIHLLALISPGPDFIVAIKNAMTYSRKTGLWTAIGFSLGITVHISYCIAGLAVLLTKYIFLFATIKYLGAIYLMYLGIRTLIAKKKMVQMADKQKTKDISPLQSVRIGFLTNLLNPKATLFILSLFTLAISPDTSYATLTIICIVMVLSTALWFMFVAYFFTQKRVLVVFNRFQHTFNKLFGGLLLAVGIKVALMQ
ncbi:MAG: LysE family transporter [Bacteroidaceae bacterium]|nr:LysE family transporter [Bacteroidaceae bacterium]